MLSRQMSRLALAVAIATASSAIAQQPGGPPRPGAQLGQGRGQMMAPQMQRPPRMQGPPGMQGPGPSLVSVLLAHTAELKLTDQQVVRLAAVARRVADERRTMRARMDSLMRTGRGRGAGVQPVRPPVAVADLERLRDQRRADIRDALSVLTADQQADAWMMRGRQGGGLGGGGGRGRGGWARNLRG